MENVTQALLNEFGQCKQRLKDIASILLEKAKEVNSWENEYLDKNHCFCELSDDFCEEIEIAGDKITFYLVRENYYGEEENFVVRIDTDKLLDDEWRECALKEYIDAEFQERLFREQQEAEQIRKEQEELERVERAELERLKAKYEGGM